MVKCWSIINEFRPLTNSTKLLKKLASDKYVQIKKVTGAVLDPVAGVFSLGTTTISDLVAAVTVVGESTNLNNTSEENLVRTGDRIVVCDKAIEPKMEDIIIIPDDDGTKVEYRIILIGGINFAGIRQVYRVICRA